MIYVYIDGSAVWSTGRSGYVCYWPTMAKLTIAEELPRGTTCAREEVYAIFAYLSEIVTNKIFNGDRYTVYIIGHKMLL